MAGAFAKIERGETDPSITRLHEIAAILQIDIMRLIRDEEDFAFEELQKLKGQLDGFKRPITDLNKRIDPACKRK